MLWSEITQKVFATKDAGSKLTLGALSPIKIQNSAIDRHVPDDPVGAAIKKSKSFGEQLLKIKVNGEKYEVVFDEKFDRPPASSFIPIIHHDSRFRTIWDWVIAVLVLYTAIEVPWEIGFEPSSSVPPPPRR
jgi:hypothetical protein